jgi:hypothetical protein
MIHGVQALARVVPAQLNTHRTGRDRPKVTRWPSLDADSETSTLGNRQENNNIPLILRIFAKAAPHLRPPSQQTFMFILAGNFSRSSAAFFLSMILHTVIGHEFAFVSKACSSDCATVSQNDHRRNVPIAPQKMRAQGAIGRR